MLLQISNTFDWSPIISGGVVTVAISILTIIFKSEINKRYEEQKELKKKVDENRKLIDANILKDEAFGAAFNEYKKNIEKENNAFGDTLKSIIVSIEKLTQKVNEQNITIAGLPQKLADLLKR